MKEKILTVLTDDTTNSQQYSDSLRRTEYLEPEKVLLLAILEDAIHGFENYRSATDRAGRERFKEAEEWIMRSGNDWIFSFDNVCALLDLNPQYLRRGLVARQEQERKTHKRHKRSNLRDQAA
ncbi:MAG TPA: hypothetical protein VLX11_11630 [Candidatus Acidoferrales bacterium]|nr:hypothetical protein [Candidatus Acidoferrales bacterium]